MPVRMTLKTRLSTMNTKVIFLDVDGVLCLGGRLNDYCARLLKQMVTITDAKLVLSSNWRLYDDFYKLLIKYLSRHGLSIYGVTNNFGDNRVIEILYWVHYFGVKQWVVLDDRNLTRELSELKIESHTNKKFDPKFKNLLASITIQKFRKNFVKTEVLSGIQLKHVDQVTNFFSKSLW